MRISSTNALKICGNPFFYDEENRLVKVTKLDDSDVIQEISYDALGRRVTSSDYRDFAHEVCNENGVTTTPTVTLHVLAGLETLEEHIYDRSDLTGAADDAWGIAREFVWGSRFPEPVMLIDYTGEDGQVTGSVGVGKTFHYLLDRLGSVVALVDSGDQSASPPVPGRIVERYTYDPYGKTLIEKPTSPGATTYTRLERSGFGNPFTWTSQRFDAATGLHAFANRMYSDTLHWLQRDPLGYVDGVSMYAYVAGRAMSATDPLGLAEWQADTTTVFGGGRSRDLADGAGLNDGRRANARDALAAAAPITNQLNGLACLAMDPQVTVGKMVLAAEAAFNEAYNNFRKDGAGNLTAAFQAAAVVVGKLIGADRMVDGIEGRDEFGNKLSATERAWALVEGTSGVVATGVAIAEIAFVASDAIASFSGRGAGEVTDCLATGGCFVAETLVLTSAGMTPIEAIRVGDRVTTYSDTALIVMPLLVGDDVETVGDDPDLGWPDDWRQVTYVLSDEQSPAHDTVQIDALEPSAWVQERHVAVGARVPYELPELGIAGAATVVRVTACPPIQAALGRVVTATMTRITSGFVRIWIDGQEPLTATQTHPFLRPDGSWVRAHELKAGDELATLDGTATVACVDVLPGRQRVYNIEVAGAHRYAVGTQLIVCHNSPAAPCTIDPRTGEEVGRFIVDPNGNTMIEPKGGSTGPYPPHDSASPDTHTYYPNGSNYQRLNPAGHPNDPTPHGHGHLPGTGPARRGQGPSLSPDGRVVPPNSPDAHWPIH